MRVDVAAERLDVAALLADVLVFLADVAALLADVFVVLADVFVVLDDVAAGAEDVAARLVRVGFVLTALVVVFALFLGMRRIVGPPGGSGQARLAQAPLTADRVPASL